MATIDSLPFELVLNIFDYCSIYDRDEVKFCLVCRRWRDPAERALYSRVVFITERSALGWLGSPARRRHRTQSLSLWRGIGKEVGLSLLEACPDLFHLEVSCDGTAAHDWCRSDAAKSSSCSCWIS